MEETSRWTYLCQLHQDNDRLVYHMREMHQRNVTLCVQACVCLCICWERPCVLTLPIVFTATRLAICSEAQTGLCVLLWADAAIRSGWLSSPSVAPCSSCFSSGEMGLCLVFCVGREGVGWRLGVAREVLQEPLTPSQGVSARSTSPDLRKQTWAN